MMNKKKPIDARLTDRVYSGETIVGGKKKMHWTKDGWKEGEKEKYDFEGSLDEFEIWLKNWKPNKEELNVQQKNYHRSIKGQINTTITILQTDNQMKIRRTTQHMSCIK